MEAIKTDYRAARLDRATKKMLEFVELTTLRPYDTTEQQICDLRKEGFGDEDILHIVHIAGYFNHINRLADALGVDWEDFMIQGRGNAKRGKELDD